MTIAGEFNKITEAQGGTPSTSGTIVGAIDALNDTLAGSDQPAALTIEGAVRLLGEHIGGGSSVTVEPLSATENKTYTAPEGKAYSPVTVNVSGTEYAITCLDDNEQVSSYVYRAIWDEDADGYIKDPDSPALDKAVAGERLFVKLNEGYGAQVSDEHIPFVWVFHDNPMFYMPSSAVTLETIVD